MGWEGLPDSEASGWPGTGPLFSYHACVGTPHPALTHGWAVSSGVSRLAALRNAIVQRAGGALQTAVGIQECLAFRPRSQHDAR